MPRVSFTTPHFVRMDVGDARGRGALAAGGGGTDISHRLKMALSRLPIDAAAASAAFDRIDDYRILFLFLIYVIVVNIVGLTKTVW